VEEHLAARSKSGTGFIAKKKRRGRDQAPYETEEGFGRGGFPAEDDLSRAERVGEVLKAGNLGVSAAPRESVLRGMGQFGSIQPYQLGSAVLEMAAWKGEKQEFWDRALELQCQDATLEP